MNKEICTLEELLQAVGAEKPFDDKQELTADGEKALDVLYRVLWYLGVCMKKVGRPPKDNPKKFQYRIRLDEQEWKKLQSLKRKGVKISDIFREALNKC